MSFSLVLGPFHPAWRGPQRIAVNLDGERVTDLEYRDGYNERGCAERLPRLEFAQALHLVSRICSTCSAAHSLAFVHAIETLLRLQVGERAQFLRVALAETERIASHLRATVAILETIGMEGRATQIHRLTEQVVQIQYQLSGSRIAGELIAPGGVRRDLRAADRDTILTNLAELQRLLYRQADSLIDYRPLLARTVDVGALPRKAAEQFGVRGPLARASGMPYDTRIDYPYAAYARLTVRVITQEGGDVYARLVVLLLEALESAKLVDQALRELPDGPWEAELPINLLSGTASAQVEGPHGVIRYTIVSDGRRMSEARIETPRQLDRLLARTLLVGAQLDNLPAIVASCDVCTACAER